MFCNNLEKVYYEGTNGDWKDILIGDSNGLLLSAIHYYYSESQPTEDGNYWHYDIDGKVVEW